jgi:hypothetical protein
MVIIILIVVNLYVFKTLKNAIRFFKKIDVISFLTSSISDDRGDLEYLLSYNT